jgi:hypothetical protein
MTRVIVRAVPDASRARCLRYLREKVADVEIVMDENYGNPTMTGRRKCALNFRRALAQAGTDPVIMLEDDILLTVDWRAKIEAAIAEQPNTLIQFFSMRGDDLRVGSRWDRNFMMTQCFYLPEGYAAALEAYHDEWAGWAQGDVSGCDILMTDWLRSRHLRYWIHVPSLVQHLEGKSAVNTKRSAKRVSKTFADPDGSI